MNRAPGVFHISFVTTGICVLFGNTISFASNVMQHISKRAIERCSSLIHQDSSVITVIPPNIPAKITRKSDTKDRYRIDLLFLNLSRAVNAKATMKTPSMDPFNLCEYSIRVWNSNGGINSPWHRGQSGQPNPDSEARTIPPKVIWLNATTRLIPINNFNVVDLEILGLGSLVEIVASLIDSKHCVFFFTNTLIQCYYRENIRSKLTSYRKL